MNWDYMLSYFNYPLWSMLRFGGEYHLLVFGVRY